MNYRIFPPEEMIEATIELPLSKSVANRLLIINALTPGTAPLATLPDCDDSRILSSVLRQGLTAGNGETLDVGAAGTAFRFSTAYFAAKEGADVVIDGTERLRQRPIKVLVDALRSLGADIEYLGEEGRAPLRIRGRHLSGGALTLDASVSSQFISALMMVAPTMETPLKLTLDGEIVSRPYIIMTQELMRRAGADVEFYRDTVTVNPGAYRQACQPIERDWSAASYWYEITAISAGFVTLPGLTLDSLQGDRATAEFYQRLGVITNPSEEVDDALELCPDPEQYSRFEQDMSENPDIAQTIAVTCAMLGIPFHLRGLASLKLKETDRLEAMRAELDKLGLIVEVRADEELVWNGQRHPVFAVPSFATYDDHRMAMAFAPVAIFIPGIIIENAEVVSKSYPRYWDDLRAAGFVVKEVDEADEAETPVDLADGQSPASSNPLQI